MDSSNRYYSKEMYTGAERRRSEMFGESGYGMEVGSAARKLHEQPYIDRDEEARRQRRAKELKARKENKKNLTIFAFTAVITGIAVALCVGYLVLRASVYSAENQVTGLQNELNELIVQNNEKQSELESNIDYSAIYDKAVNQLGMVYPESGDIVEYVADPLGYVKQYEDVPSN